MNNLLIVTAGQTDVQLLVNGERWEFKKDRCGALHDDLKKRSDWTLANAEVSKSTEVASELPTGEFQVCTPKIDAVLEFLGEKTIEITHALILDTRRSDSGDPRWAGEVLKRRLLERIQPVTVEIATFLSNRDRLEDSGNPRDWIIRREVATLVDDAVKKAIALSGPARIVLSPTGGFPNVKSLLEEVVHLRAGRTPVVVLHVSDASRTGGSGVDEAVAWSTAPSPQASFEARRHALELVREGHLWGAWGAVRHLANDDEEKRWTQVIEWLYRFASSLPLPDSCNIAILKESMGPPRTAVRAALQVEFALRAGDIPRAVHGTVAFFEAALWDHLLNGKLKEDGPFSQRYSASEAPSDDLVRLTDPTDRRTFQDDNRKRPFIPAPGRDLFRIDDSMICAIRLAEHYLKKPNLTTLAQTVTTDVRKLRNDVAHNVPTPALVEQAKTTMQEQKLWSQSDPVEFLCQDLVAKVLEELGVDSPRDLRRGLIVEVEKRLLAHTLGSTAS